jgi:glycerol-3-phosphate acyltransferase PlsX
MKIAIDAMGGDRAPGPNIDGVLAVLENKNAGQAAHKRKLEIVLVGKRDLLKKELTSRGVSALPVEIKDASQVINMDESPIDACRKKPDSSIVVGTMMLKDGLVDAFISAGNSGAVMASAVLHLERLKGVRRPAIATIFPTLKESCVIVDVGANAECKSKHLFQFAMMGESYVKYVLKRRIPRVALLSMGHEEGKGNTVTQAAYKLLMKSNLNFIGNIEGGDIINGVADVIVCDGFVGNVILKFGESVAESVLGILKQEIEKSPVRKFGAGIMKGAFRDVKKRIFYEETGGAPLLGVNGSCIICHGGASAKAIKSAINVAVEFVEQDVNMHIKESISQNSAGLLRGTVHE